MLVYKQKNPGCNRDGAKDARECFLRRQSDLVKHDRISTIDYNARVKGPKE